MNHHSLSKRLSGAVACCALVVCPVAFGGSGSGSASGLGGDGGTESGGVQLLSEAIGSLPGFWVNEEQFTALPPGLDPTEQNDLHLDVLVPEDSIQDLFSEASGNGYALLTSVEDAPDMARVRLFGQIEVELDRVTLFGTGATVEVAYGLENLGGFASLAYDGIFVGQYGLDGVAESVPVPLGNMDFMASIHSTPAVLAVVSGAPANTSISSAKLESSLGLISFTLD